MSEPTAQVSDELLAQIFEVSNATILSALRKRGYHKVYMEGVKPLTTGRRLCARAITLRNLPVRPDLAERIATGEHGDGFNNTPRWQAVDNVGPGYALVIDAMRRSNVSTGGDVVFSRILTRKGDGIVTDGAIRDGAAVAEYGFPVYAGGSTSIVGEDHILPYSVNEPVQCGGVLRRWRSGSALAAGGGDPTVGDRARRDGTGCVGALDTHGRVSGSVLPVQR